MSALLFRMCKKCFQYKAHKFLRWAQNRQQWLSGSVTNMTHAISRFAGAQMLIRKPPSQVFEAFIDPSITKNFWFTKGSDRLTLNKKITWTWEMYNLSTTVTAKEIIENEKILFEWDTPPRMVEF